MIQGKEFEADLIRLPFHEFDIILGMDWLNKYQAVVDCYAKTVVLKDVDGTETTVHGIRSSTLPKVISTLQAKTLIRKGYEAFLAVILDSKQETVNLQDIPVVSEFPDVFPEELPGLPPERDVELAIDVLPGTTPVSRAPYRMAPTELKELKDQLQELLEKGFIRPSVSPWGAPVL